MAKFINHFELLWHMAKGYDDDEPWSLNRRYDGTTDPDDPYWSQPDHVRESVWWAAYHAGPGEPGIHPENRHTKLPKLSGYGEWQTDAHGNRVRSVGNSNTMEREDGTRYDGFFNPVGRDCFVATSAYEGNEDHPTVQKLRDFRDRVLVEHTLGRAFIGLYYSGFGEKAAHMLDQVPMFKPVVRTGLEALVAVVNPVLGDSQPMEQKDYQPIN